MTVCSLTQSALFLEANHLGMVVIMAKCMPCRVMEEEEVMEAVMEVAAMVEVRLS